ncbi:Transducin/WD40 repeat-like superfamily protein [Thalictrum thalictroides]|uniref:Transducin/WD40 repeat-like superfamily protein n=1 Tax=Thalictrum thalictroides TaxID=46969 RepID=A0A7J6XG93_THATH|nr:Transducin/WD40 repeat-like superfamily protein [Thalictrum thalictroides]
MSQLLWEKSGAWRWMVRMTRDSKPFFIGFATVCAVVPGVIGYFVMQVTNSSNPELEAKLRKNARPESLMMGQVNRERLAEYLGELQRKEDTNDRYKAALKGETLTRNPYARIQPIPKPTDKEAVQEQKQEGKKSDIRVKVYWAGSNDKENNQQSEPRRKETKMANLLQLRELFGKVLSFKRSKYNFQHEYQKTQASQPMIWKYESIERIACGALEQFHIDMQTPEGQDETKFLLLGHMGGGLSLCEVAQMGKHFDSVVECMPDLIWPLEKQAVCMNAPAHIWMPGAPMLMNSTISSIKAAGKRAPRTDDVGSSSQHALVSTLGSETSGGSVYIVNLNVPRIFEVASLNCTIWTAECHADGSQAVIGTNRGAALINLETGALSWLCHSKSDVFSQQFNQAGNVVLCGFRNGAIVTVDVRQKQRGLTDVTHKIPFSSSTSHGPSSRNVQKRTKAWFKLKGSIHPSSTIFMPSSISSLATLQTDDQYFLSSSMDGSIKLYDHRLIQRGAVQSYEGHVNSHTPIQLGVDPSERLVMSGGEDGKMRIWSIKTGELLFGTKISKSVPTTVCWPGTGTELKGTSELRHRFDEDLYNPNHSWGAWLASDEEIFYIHDS